MKPVFFAQTSNALYESIATHESQTDALGLLRQHNDSLF
jgi:hypothetical protein